MVVPLLLNLLILVLVFGVIYYIVTLIPLPEPFGRIALIIVALIFLLVMLGMLGVVPVGHWRVLD